MGRGPDGVAGALASRSAVCWGKRKPWVALLSGCKLTRQPVLQGEDGDVDDGYSEGVRHAETPELAREALADCAILIFKGQVEVAFRYAHLGAYLCCSSIATFPMPRGLTFGCPRLCPGQLCKSSCFWGIPAVGFCTSARAILVRVWRLRDDVRSCREQTAGHNALLLFVHLALTMMEGRLDNAFKDLTAKKAEVSIGPLLCWVSPSHK